jgi:predicted 3-demethylubiquinone-9 3-methyltransferase (glyoxalase superfamily)
MGRGRRPMSFGGGHRLNAMNTITPCLWFDTEGEAVANFYVSVFPESRIIDVTRYPGDGSRAGQVMTVLFELDGRPFTVLNGGSQFKHSEAISFQVPCDSQEEIDHYWDTLGEGGEEGPCGWLKDRFGVSWQVFPRRLEELIADADPEVARRAMDAMMKMGKIDLAKIEEAAAAPA